MNAQKVKPMHCYELSFYATVGIKGANSPSARRVHITVWAEDEEDAVLRVADAVQNVVDREEL